MSGQNDLKKLKKGLLDLKTWRTIVTKCFKNKSQQRILQNTQHISVNSCIHHMPQVIIHP